VTRGVTGAGRQTPGSGTSTPKEPTRAFITGSGSSEMGVSSRESGHFRVGMPRTGHLQGCFAPSAARASCIAPFRAEQADQFRVARRPRGIEVPEITLVRHVAMDSHPSSRSHWLFIRSMRGKERLLCKAQPSSGTGWRSETRGANPTYAAQADASVRNVGSKAVRKGSGPRSLHGDLTVRY
jgi:hypothetical protein